MRLSLRVCSFGVAALAFLLALAPHSAAAAQMNVSMGANYFTPPNVSVNVGDTVVWINSDVMPHTVTASDGSMDSGTLQPGAAYPRTFTVPGTYSYRCLFHPGMVGTVTVVAPYMYGPAPAPAPTPTYTYVPSSVPVPPSTADQLRVQAQALLERVQQLQAQLGGSTYRGPTYQGTLPGSPSNVALDSSSCPLIGRSLKKGSQGDDVTRLQQFLARDSSIYPEGRVTGYYGELTEAAVRRWQAKYNIVSAGTPASTGYGVVGPRTAAAIALLCTTGSYGGVPGPGPIAPAAPVGGFVRVTPIVGNAPLTVAIQATVNTVSSCVGAPYLIDYGDGTIPAQIFVPPGSCQQLVQTFSHRYLYGGTYLITLSSGAHRTSATVQVYGNGPLAPTPSPTPPPEPAPPVTPVWGIVSVTPAVGGNPFAVSTQIAFPTCAAYSVDWGDSSLPATVGGQSGCASGTANATYQHTYSGAGNYTISLRDGNGAVQSTASVSIVD